jgi:aryl-alcohol dehydrogenase-like predicted oxidoreductase
MELVAVGASGLLVSRLGLGGMQFGWTAGWEDSFAVLDAYVAAGGNFVDTANIYTAWVSGHSGGESETIIGEWLAARRNRSEMVIATKVRGEMWPGRDGQGLGREHVVKACEDSLRRLGVETIDLYQCHWFDEKTPIEGTLRAFEDLMKAGKVRAIGVSNYDAARLEGALAVARDHALPGFVSLQPHYNLAHRQEFEDGLAAVCERWGLGVLPYSPLAAGFLTGKYERGGKNKSKRAMGVRKYMNDRGWRTVEAVREVAGARGTAMSTVAIAWLLGRPLVTAPILGANTPEQLAPALAALELNLSEDETGRLNSASEWR